MYEFYDNLGVYLNEDIRIVGNTYSCYLFTADKDLSTDMSDSKHHFDSGYELGQIIRSINDGLESFLPELEITLSSYAPTYYFKDFNTHLASFSSFPTVDNGCYLTLLLLHLLSMIGFVNEVLAKIIPHENTLLLKTKYIASYYSIEVLKKHGLALLQIAFYGQIKLPCMKMSSTNTTISSAQISGHV